MPLKTNLQHLKSPLIGVISTLCLYPIAPAHAELVCPLPSEWVQFSGEQDTDQQQLSADSILSTDTGITRLSGNVEYHLGDQAVYADSLDYDRSNGSGQATGNVHLVAEDYMVSSNQLNFDKKLEQLQLADADFFQPSNNLYASAEHIQREGDSLTRLTGVQFSTCAPEDQSWSMNSTELELNHENQQGTSTHTVLWFKGVPIFYTPWFRFPLGDQRQSGFLAPKIGSRSNLGTTIEIPWYWNIAPQADLTFSPRRLSRLGTQYKTDFRWLNPLGEWQLYNEYLEEQDTDRVRQLDHIKQAGTFGLWSTSVNASEVSDLDYFDDLGKGFGLSSLTHLEQRADLNYNTSNYDAKIRVQQYQTLDASVPLSEHPYRLLPQITSQSYGLLGDDALRFDLGAEISGFRHETNTEGNRLELQPKLSYSLEGPAWFLKPSLEYRVSQYQLTNTLPGSEENIDRELGIFSLDSGLFFERDADTHWQTLEPRLFYLKVPQKNQDNIPVFDTGLNDFSFAQLFRSNRFSGTDRIGDANQITLAVTTRWLDKQSGRQNASLSLGQIKYYDDRSVTLDAGPAETNEHSNTILEASLQPSPNWEHQLNLQHNPDNNEFDLARYQLAYRGPENQLANIGYRYRRDLQQQLDLSFRYQLATQWHLLGSWSKSFLNDNEREIETIAGLQYEDCCWALQAVARRYLTEDGNEHDSSIYFQLELKGLAEAGQDTDSILERGILGYNKLDE